MRVALALVIVATSVATAAPKERKAPKPDVAKDAAPPPPPRTPGPDDAKVLGILKAIEAGPDRTAKAPIEELGKLAPGAADAIGDYLHRAHAASIEDRRKLLQSIKAAVPDKAGRFLQPQRESAKEQKADDEFDWLAGLSAAADAPALGELIADDLAIRALAGAKDPHAAQIIFDAAFWPETMIYRDECGRYLRKMEPYSIPALTVESQTGKDYDRRRYATFQLEKLDRQEPGKAISATTGSEALTIAVLDAFRAVHHREAVHAVWGLVNADSPRVRKAARETWMGYVTGPPPPPAPMAHLNLAGGKKTKKAKPLYLTYRELADNELRKAANELLHEDYPLADPSIDDYESSAKTVKVDVEALSTRLFAYFDGERAKQDAAQWAEAKAKADAGDLATATAMIDRMLATNAERSERAEMAKIYFKQAKQLETKQAWADASAAYSKAQGLDPKGPNATEALAAHHYTLGKSLEAQGKDGGPDFRRAVALKPDYNTAIASAAESPSAVSAARPVWMLYAAVTAAVIALGLFGAAMLKRRAS